VILICYDGSTDAKEAIARGAALLRGHRATVLTVWSPFDTAALGLSGGVEDMQESDETGRLHAEHQAEAGARLATEAASTPSRGLSTGVRRSPTRSSARPTRSRRPRS
jgi:Universal stress protein family